MIDTKLHIRDTKQRRAISHEIKYRNAYDPVYEVELLTIDFKKKSRATVPIGTTCNLLVQIHRYL